MKIIRTKYYHVDEVAELLGLTLDEVRGMLKRKELKGHKNGRRWLIDMKQPYFENLVCISPTDHKQEIFFRYIKDAEHEEIIYNNLYSVKQSLHITTANFKNVTIHGDSLVSILNNMVKRGIKITIICSKLQTKEMCDFELIVCPRNHMKLFIFDEKILYIGSANLTPAALNRNYKSKKTNNHEAGILTDAPQILNEALKHFKHIYQVDDCRTCKIKTCGLRESQLD